MNNNLNKIKNKKTKALPAPFHGQPWILSLSTEILCMIMNELAIEAKPDQYNRPNLVNGLGEVILPKARQPRYKNHPLIALLMSHSLFYDLGLPIYYATLSRPLVLCPYKVAWKSYSSKACRYGGGNLDLFNLYPNLRSKINSVAIYDYWGDSTKLDEWSKGKASNFSSFLGLQLGFFQNLTKIYIEIGHCPRSMILLDLLFLHPTPIGLKSLSIMLHNGIFDEANLSLYDRNYKLHDGETVDFLKMTLPPFCQLEYLKIGRVFTGPKDRYDDIAHRLLRKDMSSSSYSQELFRFQRLVTLLEKIVFTYSQQSLKHLVLENVCPTMIFDTPKFFSRIERKLCYTYDFSKNLINRRSYYGLPALTLLEVNNCLTDTTLNGIWGDFLCQPITEEETMISNDLTRGGPLSVRKHLWVFLFLIGQALHNHDFEDDLQAIIPAVMVALDKNIIVGLPKPYFTIGEYIQERHQTSSYAIKVMGYLIYWFVRLPGFLLPYKKVTPRQWRILCQMEGLNCD